MLFSYIVYMYDILVQLWFVKETLNMREIAVIIIILCKSFVKNKSWVLKRLMFPDFKTIPVIHSPLYCYVGVIISKLVVAF